MSILFLTVLMIKIVIAAGLVYVFLRYILPVIVVVAGIGLIVALVVALAHLGG